MQFTRTGEVRPELRPFVQELDRQFRLNGHQSGDESLEEGLVIYAFDPTRPKSYRRQNRAVFVIGVTVLTHVGCSLPQLYPLLVRTMSNLLIVLEVGGSEPIAHLVTPEHGHVRLPANGHFEQIFAHIEPLATSRLVIDNEFVADLEPELWHGDDKTEAIRRAGQYMAQLNLLPAPFPIEDVLSARDLRWLKSAYGIGGLSYGNFSARLDATRFWMSASGVDKSRLDVIGRDILLVTGYDDERKAMRLSVPPDIEPRRVSVDAIEHWMIYREQPAVGAILHVHAWLDGIVSTQVQYPCGTYELASAVNDLILATDDPAHAVVGLKNHGVTITGFTLDEIIERFGAKLTRNVPMS